MHDVARIAGVSIKTVSNVINDFPHVRAETRARVRKAIEELEYLPNLSARGLRSGRTGVISLIVPDIRNAYFSELADAVMWAAEARGLSVIIEQAGYDRNRELLLLRGPRTQLVDGILYSALALGEEDAGVLDSVNTPVVLLGERIFNGPTDHVTMQNVEGVQAATEHLLGQGRRRVLAFGSHPGEEIGSAGLRLVGYKRALANAGVEFDEALVCPVELWLRADGARAMRDYLACNIPFDGVVAFNDLLALGAMRVMQEAGIRIPHDVAVVGFDNIDETKYTLPSLSSIDPGREEIAEVAVKYLIERIASANTPLPPREHLTAFRLIERESSAPNRPATATESLPSPVLL